MNAEQPSVQRAGPSWEKRSPGGNGWQTRAPKQAHASCPLEAPANRSTTCATAYPARRATVGRGRSLRLAAVGGGPVIPQRITAALPYTALHGPNVDASLFSAGQDIVQQRREGADAAKPPRGTPLQILASQRPARQPATPSAEGGGAHLSWLTKRHSCRRRYSTSTWTCWYPNGPSVQRRMPSANACGRGARERKRDRDSNRWSARGQVSHRRPRRRRARRLVVP